MFKPVSLAALLLASLPLATAAQAQTPPSATEAAAYTGLHKAAQTGDVAEIARLGAAKADANARDGAGRTPLHVAAFARQRDAMRALARIGADPRALENSTYDAITIAAVADDVATMRVALEIGGSAREITSPYIGTALIAAAHLGHVEVVRELIRAGAPLDHVNNLHWTALIEAVVLGDGGARHTECVRLLVEAGARRDLADREGRTPLDLARQRGYAEMVRLLSR